MNARTVIGILAFLLWTALTVSTFYVLIKEGPDVLVFISLLFILILGAGIFGALNDRRGGPR